MDRRQFVQHGAMLGGAVAVSRFNSREFPEPKTMLPDLPAAISEAEREQRREKARGLMKSLGFSAMLIEPGANMTYFAGIEWARSERLFAFILPQTGRPVVVSPAF